MKIIIFTLPVSLLVAYSQLVVKWRAVGLNLQLDKQSFLQSAFQYLSDPYIFSAYFSALLGSMAWLLVITKLPLSIGFPVYIGLTFFLVVLGSWLLLGEPISTSKLLAIMLIFAGVVLGVLE